MDVEILEVEITNGIVTITAVDVSEETLCKMERLRHDTFDHRIQFEYNTNLIKDFDALRWWLRQQKAAKDCKTWTDALHSTVGTITVIPRKYRCWF